MTQKKNSTRSTRTTRRKTQKETEQSGLEIILDYLLQLLKRTGIWGIITLFLLAVIVLGICYLWNHATDMSASTEVDQTINVTPTQISAMKQIGEWEFLSVNDEELVDTMRRGFFSDDELIRIYYGTLRLGINMNDVSEDWIGQENDTIVVKLPPIRLLDERFIDEARTKSFFESGKWSDADREAMYQRARQRMRTRGLSDKNIASAEQNASRSFYQMMRSMGFEHIKVRFK